MSAALDAFRVYVQDVYKASLYQTWSAANTADHNRWTAYANAILSGQAVTPPAMATAFGTSLVDVGRLYQAGAGAPAPAPAPAPALKVTVAGTAVVGKTLQAAIA